MEAIIECLMQYFENIHTPRYEACLPIIADLYEQAGKQEEADFLRYTKIIGPYGESAVHYRIYDDERGDAMGRHWFTQKRTYREAQEFLAKKVEAKLILLCWTSQHLQLLPCPSCHNRGWTLRTQFP